MRDIESQDFRFKEGNQYTTLPKLQLLIIGDTQTGKSSFTNLITQSTYPESFKIRNINKTQGCEIRVGLRKQANSSFLIQLMDLSGDKAQRNYLDIYLSRCKANAIIFCFDVTNLKSLDNLRKWIKRMDNLVDDQDSEEQVFSRQSSITEENNDQLIDFSCKPFIFVGCKMDQIPMDKHDFIRQQVHNKLQQIYPSNAILLSNTQPKLYQDQFEELEKIILQIKTYQNISQFILKQQVHSKIIQLDESFWKNTFSSSLLNKMKIIYIQFKYIFSFLFCKRKSQ